MVAGVRVVVVVSCAVVAAMAYALYVPLPDGFVQPWKTRVVLTVTELAISMFWVMDKVGVANKTFLMRSMEKYVRKTHSTLKVEDTEFDRVKVRTYQPRTEGATDRPAIVYFHGGGWTLGSADFVDAVTASLAKRLNYTVVSVEYRLAPENKFPAAFDDCVTATRYLLRNAKDFGVDPSRIAVAGDSAGGNLAAAVALKLRDTTSDLPKVKVQVLLYPALQAIDFETSSYRLGITPILTRHQMIVFWSVYAQGHANNAAALQANNHTAPRVLEQLRKSRLDWARLPREFNAKPLASRCNGCGDVKLWAEIENVFMNPYFAPLMVDDLANLPTAYVVTANHDVLRDDGAMYAERLRQAGNIVTHRYWHVGFHNIIIFSQIPEGDETFDEVVRFLAENL